MSARGQREVARRLLERVEDGGFANVVVPKVLRSSALDDRQRAFVTDLVYGTLRRRIALDYLLTTVSDRRLDRLDPPVRAALRLGAYQLVEGIPAHAAVSETVSAAPSRARGYVNAVLRRLARLGPDWPWPTGDDPSSLSIRCSYPEWIVERLFADLGAEAGLGVLDAGNAPPGVTLRPNRLVTTSGALTDELAAAGIDVHPGRLIADALVVRGTGDPARLPAVADGRATPQDQASQAVVAALGPHVGETVIEIGAAPGGKSTAIAEAVGPTGHVLALDINPGRTRLVVRAARRLHLDPTVDAVVADGRAVPLRPAVADRVLVDAPCSGLGVLGRRPDARSRIQPADVVDLAALQRALLAEAAPLVRTGGVLVYSVCTLTNAETLEIDDWARTALPDLSAEDPPGEPWRRHGRGALLLPQAAGTDGMYVLRLRRAQASKR